MHRASTEGRVRRKSTPPSWTKIEAIVPEAADFETELARAAVLEALR